LNHGPLGIKCGPIFRRSLKLRPVTVGVNA
jgi:hypothetical protein